MNFHFEPEDFYIFLFLIVGIILTIVGLVIFYKFHLRDQKAHQEAKPEPKNK